MQPSIMESEFIITGATCRCNMRGGARCSDECRASGIGVVGRRRRRLRCARGLRASWFAKYNARDVARIENT